MKRLGIVFASFFLISLLIAAPAFAYEVDIEWSKMTGGIGKVLLVEDIDDDGILEAVVARWGGFIVVLEFVNNEWIAEWESFMDMYTIVSAKIGDLDGDGSKDIFIYGTSGSDGRFKVINIASKELLISYIIGNEVMVDLFDTDGDGRDEVLFQNSFNLNFRLKRNGWDEVWSYQTESYLVPQFVDIDNDGVTEIVVVKQTWDPVLGEYTGHTISVINGVTFETEWEDTALDGKIWTFTTGDMDNDGVMEIVTATRSLDGSSHSVTIYDGITKEVEWIDIGRPNGYSKLMISDVDSDGGNELIAYYRINDNSIPLYQDFIEIYDGATMSLEWASDKEGFFIQNYFEIELMDIDADGVTDIICRNGNKFTIFDGKTKEEKPLISIPMGLIPNFFLMSIDADEQLEIISGKDLSITDGKTGILEYDGYILIQGLAIGDVDGDGTYEILIAEEKDGVVFHILDGITKSEEGSFSVPGASAIHAYLFLGDTDSDGTDEIFFKAIDENQEARDYIVNGITGEIIWHGQPNWYPKKLVDIDNDGEIELLSSSGYAGDIIYVYDLGTKEIEWEVPGTDSLIDVVDVDGDGVLEIIRGTVGTSWQNDGFIYVIDTQTHEIEWSLENMPNGCEGICVYDVDSDGAYEIIYGTYGGRIYILDGASKAVEGEFDKLPYLHGIAVGDVDDDGDNEIVATDGWNDWNRLFIFDGVTYEEEWNSLQSFNSLGKEAHKIDIIDIDSDNINEIIVRSSGYLHILGLHIEQPPIMNPIGNKEVDEYDLLEFTISAMDPEGVPLEYSIEGLPSGAIFTDNGDGTALFSWTPTYYQANTYPVKFIVSDGYYSDSEDIVITVNNVNAPPVFSHIADKEILGGTLLKFSVSAVDIDNDALNYGAEDLPEDAVFDAATKEFSWQPTASDMGSYTVTFTVTDGNLTVSNAVEIDVIRKEAQLSGKVSIEGYRLYTQSFLPDGTLTGRRPYKIKGVCWSPASIGTIGGGDLPGRKAEFIKWHQTDIPLMKKMGVNTVRVFMDFGTNEAALEILDMLYQNGIMAMVTVDNTIADRDNIEAVVNLYKDHPAVLMWLIGNEWDYNLYYGVYQTVNEAKAATEEMAQLVKQLDPDHPVGSTIIYSSISRIEDIVASCPSVDVWGMNIYLGASFWGFLGEWDNIMQSTGMRKPVFFSEMGCDAYDYKIGSENQRAQADFDGYLWREVYPDLSADDPENVCLGATYFEWSDEWWKRGRPTRHDTTGFYFAMPDGYSNEEWYGIVDIYRAAPELSGT